MSQRITIIVGASYAGTVMARALAEAGWRVRVIDKRPHIAGNAHDEADAHGVLVRRQDLHRFDRQSACLIWMHSLTYILSMTYEAPMETMTIRIDDRIKQRLRVRAARHGRSMEDEARDILRSRLTTDTTVRGSLVASIRARIEPLGGVELELPARDAVRAPPH